MAKSQLHKRFSSEQIKDILGKVINGHLRTKEACSFLCIGRTRLHQLTKSYQADSGNITVSYKRKTSNNKLSLSVKEHILRELAIEKEKIIDNPAVPTNRYNYSYIKSLLSTKYHEEVSLPTIISLAKANDYWKAKHKKEQNHTRIVLTHFIGELIQHDSSEHLFAPDAFKKWHLITSLDDYSRKILSAQLVLRETSYIHIKTVEGVCLRYGIPFSYYVDQHSIFRYVKDRDKFYVWTSYTKFTGDVDSQWAAILKDLSVKPIYALSPQAKGKIERPYQWLQDHLVRTCVRYGITKIGKGQEILDEEVNNYNTKKIHSVTGEIPDIRFNKAIKEGKTLFRPFSIPAPYRSTKDIFALRDQRITDGYRSISLYGKRVKVPNANPYMDVDLRLVPGVNADTIDIRFLSKGLLLGVQTLPAVDLPDVHF